MTRVLLDTNVVLDFLLDRAPFADAAAALWQANDDGRIDAYVLVITPVNVFYIARKLKGAALLPDRLHRAIAPELTRPRSWRNAAMPERLGGRE